MRYLGYALCQPSTVGDTLTALVIGLFIGALLGLFI